MASEIFIDSGGFYALLCPHDLWHAKAKSIIERAPQSQLLTTTDYVLGETATLLRSRNQSQIVEPWLNELFVSGRFEIIWMDPDRFHQVRLLFVRHSDKEWSFTDCFSFCVMKERKCRRALAADHHFTQAGFQPLLID